MKKSQINRWSPIAVAVLMLSLWMTVMQADQAADVEDKPLTQTEKELLFRENGLLKDHFFGYTKLILASLHGDLAGAKKALNEGDKVNWKMEWGYTALMLAADQGQLEIVRLLVESGADPKLTNDEGKTALDLARRENRTAVVTYLTSLPPSH